MQNRFFVMLSSQSVSAGLTQLIRPQLLSLLATEMIPSPFLTVEALLVAAYPEIAFVYFLNELGTLHSHIF